MIEDIPEALRGCQLKTRRAEFHLNTLRDELASFEKDRPYRITGQFEPDTRDYLFFLEPDQDPAIRWGVIAGDILNNLRSALDHLVYALATLKTPDPKGTRFPVFIHERPSAEVPEDRAYRPTGVRQIRDVPDICKSMFEIYQPYKRPDRPEWHILEVMRVLSNEDKHKLVPVAAASIFATGLRGVGPIKRQHVERIETIEIHFGRPLVGKTEIARARIVPSGSDPQMELDENFAFFISLHHAAESLNERDVFALFESMGRYVANILATFEPVFLGGRPELVGRP